MKLKKVLAVVALVGLFVVGSAFAAEEISQFRNGNNGAGIGATNMEAVTGMTEAEIEEYRSENCPGGISMIENLKEQGLYEEWKENITNEFEERLQVQLENGVITEEELAQALADLNEAIEQGPPFSFGKVMGRGNRRSSNNDVKVNRNR